MPRKRNRTLETLASPFHNNQIDNEVTQSHNTMSGYEQTREKRIKENLERMQKLGIVDLSIKLNSFNKPAAKKYSLNKTPDRPPSSLPPPLAPTRRSSRLQNVTPVSYSEAHRMNMDGSSKDEDILLEEGSKPEVYTEDHEKLLGDCKMSWTLWVDGYGKDGKRIYDPVKGKTCHQCRQKTLGHRTQCSQCNMVQGQFCGDCLYTRYGENVLEANQNPNWICPVCRGICNCSLCRQAKGWPPTGTLYRKISSLGFKSVAHYLIQTQRSQTNPGNSSVTKTPLSAKRSMAFSDMEAQAPSTDFNDDHLGLPKSISEYKSDEDDKLKGEENKEMHFSENGDSSVPPESSPKNGKSCSILEPSLDSIPGRLGQRHANKGCDNREELFGTGAGASEFEKGSNLFTVKVDGGNLGLSETQSEDERDGECRGKEDKGICLLDNSESIVAQESSWKETKTASPVEPSSDSIARRLRQRRIKEKSCKEEELVGPNETLVDDGHLGLSKTQSEDKRDGECSGKEDKGTCLLDNRESTIDQERSWKKNETASHVEPSSDSIAGRLKRRNVDAKGCNEEFVGSKEETLVAKKIKNNISSESNADKIITEPSPDSIAGRLRSRRKIT